MIQQSEIKFYKSSATDSEGGDISATEIADGVLNNLFADISGDDTVAGETYYKKVFIKNTNGTTTLENTNVWIESPTTSEDDEIYVSLCTNITGTDATADGQNYVHPTSAVHVDVLEIGDIAPGEYVALWIKRVLSPNAEEFLNNEATLAVLGSYQL